MRCRFAHRAFTLIEILISLAIVSTIVTMVYGSYAATSRSLDTYGSRLACSERAQLVLRMMARQIRCAYLPPTPAPAKQADTGHSGTSPAAFRAEPHGLGGDLLSLVTTGGFGLGPDNPLGISRVAYRYDKPRATLLICCEPHVGRRGSEQDASVWRSALTGLATIEMEFHDGRLWQSAWDSNHAGTLPRAVKIGLTVMDENGREHHYTTTVSILCRAASQGRQVKTPAGKP